MRSFPISLQKSEAGDTYSKAQAIPAGYGFRIRPFLDNGKFIGIQPNDQRPVYNCPGRMPILAIVKEWPVSQYERLPWHMPVERRILISNGGWYSFPKGFESVDLYCASPIQGDGLIGDMIPFLKAPIPMNYIVDLADSQGERADSYQYDSESDLELYGSGAETPLAVEPVSGTPNFNVQSVEDLYGKIAGLFYIQPQFKRIKLVFTTIDGTEDLHVYQSYTAVYQGGTFNVMVNVETIPASEWIVQNDGGKMIVLNRDCFYANEWIWIVASKATAAGTNLISGTAIYRNF